MSTTGWDGLHQLLTDVRALREELLDAEAKSSPEIGAVNPRHRFSATNLVHYVELRSRDIRDLQLRLAAYGLSSLGRSESHVMETLDALVEALEHLVGVREVADAPPEVSAEGEQILSRNAIRLLGPAPADRMTRIMVTLPSEAAEDPEIVRSMLSRGMDIARINCAHDGPAEWEAMIANIRAAEAATGRSCLISMDLGGPKLRTGPIQLGAPVLKLRPQRDEIGRVVGPALVWLGTRPESAPEPVVALEEPGWAARRRVGDTLRMVDARDARRRLTVEAVLGTDASYRSVTPSTSCRERRSRYAGPGNIIATLRTSPPFPQPSGGCAFGPATRSSLPMISSLLRCRRRLSTASAAPSPRSLPTCELVSEY